MPHRNGFRSNIPPSGTEIEVGLVGYQYGQPVGTWFQIYVPESVPYEKAGVK
jgi:hypothetical protein